MVHISERESSLPDLEFPKILKKIESDKNIISLGPGEPDFPAPKPLTDYIKKVANNSSHYTEPQGMLELREAIAKKVKKDNGIKTNPENVIVCCGSQEALFTALLTTIDPTEKVIVQSPGYLGYLPAVELVNGVPVFMELREDEGWQVNPDRLRKLIDKKTKAIILTTPSNPTGTVLDKKILEEIADIAIDKNLHIFSDEAYQHLTYGKKHVSIGSFNGMQNNVTTFHTFSKSYAMCGFRVGYAIGSKKIIHEMTKVHNYVTLSAPTLSQKVALKALSLPNIHLNKMKMEYTRRRNYIVNRLNSLGMRTMMPEGAFYAFANIQKYSDSSVNFARKLIDKAKVAVIPGTEFGPHGQGYVRCSFATAMPKIETAMDRIEKFLK